MPIIPRRPDRNAFEAARRAKVDSVIPGGFARNDIDAAGSRAPVFELLHSFDTRGLDEKTRAARTLELLRETRDAETALANAARHLSAMPAPGATSSTRTMQLADDAMIHRFECSGSAFQLPENIDWNTSPGNAHWGNMLNRFNFLLPLAEAFELTGDRKYLDKGAWLILHWIETTDICDSLTPGEDPAQWRLSVRKPTVWLSHLEPAIHLVKWAEFFLRVLPKVPDLLTPAQWLAVVKSVHDQLRWLDLIIPEGGHGNGLTAGAGCQLIALAHFPDLRDGEPIARTAMERLSATLDKQVLPDGVQHELTPHYHCCVAADLLGVLKFEKYLPASVPIKLRETARKMLVFVRHSLTPCGRQVAFNDGDAEGNEWVTSMLAGKTARGLLGADADTELTSTCFPCAGFMTLRQGSHAGKDELFLAFDGGPFGNCHQHEDKLTIWLSAFGRPLLVDPGRDVYDKGAGSLHSHIHETRGHSTIRIDGHDQNSRPHKDRWVSWEPLPLAWRVEADGGITASAAYDLGFGPDAIPVTHRRTIRFVHGPAHWVIDDELIGEGEHEVESRWQFAPGELQIERSHVRTKFDRGNLRLDFEPEKWDKITVERGQRDPMGGWYVPIMGQPPLPAPMLVLTSRMRLPATVRITLTPSR